MFELSQLFSAFAAPTESSGPRSGDTAHGAEAWKQVLRSIDAAIDAGAQSPAQAGHEVTGFPHFVTDAEPPPELRLGPFPRREIPSIERDAIAPVTEEGARIPAEAISTDDTGETPIDAIDLPTEGEQTLGPVELADPTVLPQPIESDATPRPNADTTANSPDESTAEPPGDSIVTERVTFAPEAEVPAQRAEPAPADRPTHDTNELPAAPTRPTGETTVARPEVPEATSIAARDTPVAVTRLPEAPTDAPVLPPETSPRLEQAATPARPEAGGRSIVDEPEPTTRPLQQSAESTRSSRQASDSAELPQRAAASPGPLTESDEPSKAEPDATRRADSLADETTREPVTPTRPHRETPAPAVRDGFERRDPDVRTTADVRLPDTPVADRTGAASVRAADRVLRGESTQRAASDRPVARTELPAETDPSAETVLPDADVSRGSTRADVDTDPRLENVDTVRMASVTPPERDPGRPVRTARSTRGRVDAEPRISVSTPTAPVQVPDGRTAPHRTASDVRSTDTTELSVTEEPAFEETMTEAELVVEQASEAEAAEATETHRPADRAATRMTIPAVAAQQPSAGGSTAAPTVDMPAFAAGPTAPGETGSAAEAATPVRQAALAQAIAARARAVPEGGAVELRFALEPEDLGPIRVRIESRGDQLKIQILTANGAALETLQAGLSRFNMQLNDAGIRDAEIDFGLDPFSDTTGHDQKEMPQDQRDERRSAWNHETPYPEATGSSSRRGDRSPRLDMTA